MGPPVRAGGFGEVDGDFFTGRCGFEGPGGVVDLDGVRKVALWGEREGVLADIQAERRQGLCLSLGQEGGSRTSIIGSCPLIWTLSFIFFSSTIRSRAL